MPTTRRMVYTCALMGATAVAMSAAQPAAATPSPSDSVEAGPQAVPPAPPPPDQPPLDPDDRGRRAVRGCPVDAECRDLLRAELREFEREAFAPPRRDSPWIDSDDAMGRERARHGTREPVPADLGARRASRAPVSPTELRPDLPWLADLEMPDLPVRWDHRVIRFLEFYKDDPRGRRIMSSWLRRQTRYRDLILSNLRRAKLPDDLLYVAMIESSYDPTEYSRAGASGLWQFMPAGGRIYGLHIDRWLDERNCPERSTEAAMLYFADLYQRFGNWDLALAAYNAGYGAVLHGIAKYNTNDFWELLEYENALPWESSVYVPKALAAAIVGRNRAVFGFDRLEPLPEVRWDRVMVPTSVPLAVVARAAGATVEEIQRLNPQLRRGRTPPGATDYVVRIPEGRTALFAQRFPQLRGDWDGYEAYVVAHGERFEDVATKHGLSRQKLAALNDISHQSELGGGTILVVPVVSEEDKRRNLERARDDLYSAGVPRGEPGEKLIVAVPDKDLTVPGKRRVFYRVVIGDTLWGVSRAFRVDRAQLAEWNGLDPEAHLHPRMVLQVFVDPGLDLDAAQIQVLDESRIELVERGSSAHLDGAERRMGRERFVYTPQTRETYADIGKKFGLTSRDVARINRRPYNTVVEPGEEVILYRVVDPDRSERARDQSRRARSPQPRSRPRR